jgi:uncharacterized protein YrrD
MRKAKELNGLAVVDIGAGTKIGSVDGPIINPADGRIMGLMLKGGGNSHGDGFVAARDIHAIGADAVTVSSGEVVRPREELDDSVRAAWESRDHIVGNKVVTESGSLIGTVSDYYVDEDAIRVAGLTIGGGLLSSEDAVAADRVMSVGPDAIVVRDEQAGREDAAAGAEGWGAGA